MHTPVWRRLAALLLPLLLGACAAFPSKQESSYRPDLGIPQTTRIAAQAMLENGFIPAHQNERMGFVHGERDEQDPLGGFHGSFHLTVTIAYRPDGTLGVQTESRAGPEVALSNDPPRYLAAFEASFNRLMQAALAKAAPPPAPTPSKPPHYRNMQDLAKLPVNWGMGIYDGKRGISISYLNTARPAYYAGLSGSDTIVAVDGHTVASAAAAAERFRVHDILQPLQLSALRRGWREEFWLVPMTDRPVNYIPPTPEQRALEEEGFALGRQKKYEEAVANFRKSLAIKPRHEAYYGLGLYLYRLQRYQEAEQAFARAMSLSNAYDRNLLISLGSTLAAQGKESGARALWQAVAREDDELGQLAKANLEKLRYGAFLVGAGAPAEGRADHRMAHLVLAPTEREQDGKRKLTGDGLREVLRTALLRSGYFTVDTIGDDLRGSRADVVLHTLITEFDGQAKSATFGSSAPGALLGLGQKYKEAHITVELRLTDRRSGKELARLSIPGVSIDTQTGLVLNTAIGRIRLPGDLESYQDTPMERAIEHWLHKAVTYSMNAVPERYFK